MVIAGERDSKYPETDRYMHLAYKILPLIVIFLTSERVYGSDRTK
jgi:hypothetical protein